MRKNIMRTPEEKEKIILEMIETCVGYHTMNKKYGISKSTLWRWFNNYQIKGKEGLKSNTGKNGKGKGNFKRTELEQLKEDLLKKEIELMRLKKGYMVKGVGAKKEYVSISDLDMK